jgi:hypothetical protein
MNTINHKVAGITVYQTTDYDLFAMIQGNRSLDLNKIRKIITDIENGINLLPYCPVLVHEKDGRLHIIDGQHRFAVSKKIKSPVYYILAENLSLYAIARMNSNTEKWKGADFVQCYCELGNPHYLKLDKLLKQFPGLAITTAINLLATGHVQAGSVDSVNDKFQRGELQVLHEKTALKVLETAFLFDLPYRLDRVFMKALEKIIEANIYPLEELAERVKTYGLERQSHWRKYLTEMEEIVNKGKHKRVTLY